LDDQAFTTQDDTIWIVTDAASEPLAPDGSRGWRNQAEVLAQKEVPISASKLQNEMERFLNLVGRLFSHAEQQQLKTKTKMCLDEIELSVEISAEGQVVLVGKASSKGGIKMKFKRTELPDSPGSN